MAPREIDERLREVLLDLRTPASLADVIERQAEREGVSSEVALRRVWPVLWDLIRLGVVVQGEHPWQPLKQRLADGEAFEGVSIERCIRAMRDCEVYSGRVIETGAPAILKIVGQYPGKNGRRRLVHEAEVLGRLDGSVSPTLLATGVSPFEYLVAARCPGVPLVHWVERSTPRDGLGVATAIVAAYALLHAQGVLHGDVNPNNLLVDGKRVWIVDFAASQFLDEPAGLGRMGVLPYQEPEYLSALLLKTSLPPVTPLGEQYSVAALAYFAIARQPPVELETAERASLESAAEARPVPLTSFGIQGMERVEVALHRALAKEPSERFPSLESLCDELANASMEVLAERAALESGWGAVLRPGGAWFERGLPTPPRASVHYGAAGVALCLLEDSLRSNQAEALFIAGEWLRRAKAGARSRDAFSLNGAPELDAVVTEGVSVLHAGPGLHWVSALLAFADGNAPARERSVLAFIRASDRPWLNADLTLGRSGTLAACAALVTRGESASARAFGDRVYDELWARVLSGSPVGSRAPKTLNLGMAHGWAGVLWASALWHKATGREVPSTLRAVAHRVRELGVEREGGLAWPWYSGSRDIYMHGWCNGTAGMVLAFCALFEVDQEEEWLVTAVRAGRGLRRASWGLPHICCGAAGAAFALARLWRLTKDLEWLDGAVRARDAALSLRGRCDFPGSLYKGDVASILLEVPREDLSAIWFPGFEAP